MVMRAFNRKDLLLVRDALEIAEDVTGDYFKLSLGQWKRYRYDVRTLSALRKEEIRPHAFALLNKSSRVVSEFESKTKKRDFYLICLQDHRILNALRRDKDLGLLSLLIYVLTHELVHVVRFCNFLRRFETSWKETEKEEQIVHTSTYEILKNLSVPKLDYILDSYRTHRICEIAAM